MSAATIAPSAPLGAAQTPPCAAPTGVTLGNHDFKSITERLLAGETVIERCDGAVDSEALRCDLRFRCTPTDRLVTTWPKAVA